MLRALATPLATAPNWLWLFPATYAVHVLEEGFAGERFYRWIRHASGRTLAPDVFWAANGALWLMMVVAVLVARSNTTLGWISTALGTLVAVNGAGHIVGTLLTRKYSPGLVSGAILWLPLGVSALWGTWQTGPRLSWATGVVVGIAVQGGVASLALVLSRRDSAA